MGQIPIQNNRVDYNIRKSVSKQRCLVIIGKRAVLRCFAAVVIRLTNRHNGQDCVSQCLIDLHAQPSNVSSLAMISI